MKGILEMLAGSGYVSGEKISHELGISRAAVWKRIEQLREEGWRIESGGKRGYRLLADDSVNPVFWQEQLTTRELGRGENCYQPTLESTNTTLKQMAVHGAPNGSLCVCDCQTGGKGRLGRSWVVPSGQGLLLSVLLRPHMLPRHAPLITLAAAIAMTRAVQETTSLDVRIKWPNDIVCKGKKICGILLEISADPDQIEYVVVGTGLNVRRNSYPPELADKAGALEEFAAPPLRRDVLTHYLRALEDTIDLLEKDGFAGIQAEYRRYSCTLGSAVRVIGTDSEFTGVAEELDETGALLVRMEDGTLRRVLSGDVSVRGLMGYV